MEEISWSCTSKGEFWEQDGLGEQHLDEFFMHVTESDSSADESSEEPVDTSV